MIGKNQLNLIKRASECNCAPLIISVTGYARYEIEYEPWNDTLESVSEREDTELLHALLEQCKEKILVLASINIHPSILPSDVVYNQEKNQVYFTQFSIGCNDIMEEFDEMKQTILSKVYTKEVSELESELYQLASVNGIAPEIISIEGNELTSKKYPKTVTSLIRMKSPELNNVLDKAKEQLIKLHQIGILHRDISEDNIAVSADDTDVKLIDFGMSKYIKDIGDIDIEYYQDLYYEGVSRAGEPEATLDYVLRLEHACLETLR